MSVEIAARSQPLALKREPIGKTQRQLDRQLHVGHAHLGDDRAVMVFHHGMHDGLGMNKHANFFIGDMKKIMRLNHFKTLIDKRGRIDGDFRPMDHVGWLSACRGVIELKLSGPASLKGTS